MLAVSVEQPHAAAILAALRPVTCRFRQTDHRGPPLIHAARRKAGPASPGWVEGLTRRGRPWRANRATSAGACTPSGRARSDHVG
jgi:hypothetical protein